MDKSQLTVQYFCASWDSAPCMSRSCSASPHVLLWPVASTDVHDVVCVLFFSRALIAENPFPPIRRVFIAPRRPSSVSDPHTCHMCHMCNKFHISRTVCARVSAANLLSPAPSPLRVLMKPCTPPLSNETVSGLKTCRALI